MSMAVFWVVAPCRVVKCSDVKECMLPSSSGTSTWWWRSHVVVFIYYSSQLNFNFSRIVYGKILNGINKKCINIHIFFRKVKFRRPYYTHLCFTFIVITSRYNKIDCDALHVLFCGSCHLRTNIGVSNIVSGLILNENWMYFLISVKNVRSAKSSLQTFLRAEYLLWCCADRHCFQIHLYGPP
jgi:hypothetical protein